MGKQEMGLQSTFIPKDVFVSSATFYWLLLRNVFMFYSEGLGTYVVGL